MARALGDANFMRSLNCGGTKKDIALSYYDRRTFYKNVHNASNVLFDIGKERQVYVVCAFEKIDVNGQTHNAIFLELCKS